MQKVEDKTEPTQVGKVEKPVIKMVEQEELQDAETLEWTSIADPSFGVGGPQFFLSSGSYQPCFINLVNIVYDKQQYHINYTDGYSPIIRFKTVDTAERAKQTAVECFFDLDGTSRFMPCFSPDDIEIKDLKNAEGILAGLTRQNILGTQTAYITELQRLLSDEEEAKLKKYEGWNKISTNVKEITDNPILIRMVKLITQLETDLQALSQVIELAEAELGSTDKNISDLIAEQKQTIKIGNTVTDGDV